MKHFALSFFLIIIFALNVGSQDFIRVDKNNADGKIFVSRDQVLEVRLPSNPSTGYSWYLTNSSNNIMKQVGDWDFISDNPNQPTGAAGTQVIRFVGTSAGTAELQLSYSRPWEKNKEPLEVYKITIESEGKYTGTYTSSIKPIEPVNYGESTRALPAAFSWQSQCTKVKDQGSCGSCWSFTTTGSFEAVVNIWDNTPLDFSEQFLVNCHTASSGCSGGSNSSYSMYTKFGAVNEVDLPYKQADGTCGTYTYHQKGISYKTVTNSVASIKQAVYDYGPIYTAINAGNNFQNYSSGILTQTDGTTLNHAVLICGWDDNNGTNGHWIIKNSWGPNWGESGYLKVKYGVSGVGGASAYIDYKGVIPHTPSGVADVTNGSPVDIFPNPGNGLFTASFQAPDNDNYVIKISNTLGQIVYQESLSNFSGTYSRQLDITNYGKGLYILSVESSKEQYVRKIVVCKSGN